MTKLDRLQQFFMTCAVAASKLSVARRAQVGAVLVKDGRIVSTGYNGQPAGFDNNCEIENPDGTLTTKSSVVHAEMNAILFCAKYGLSTNDTDLYITLSPCSHCVKAIIQSGIKHVYYLEEYRDTAGIEMLEQAGISVSQISIQSLILK